MHFATRSLCRRAGQTTIPTLFACCLAITALTAFGQPDKKEPAGMQDKDKSMQPAGGMDMSKMPPEQMKEMEAYKAAAMPGPEHKGLMNMVGTWDADQTMWMAPGAPPMNSKGVMKNESMFDGRYIHMHYKGEPMPAMGMNQPFEGAGVVGYDNAMKKYVSTWFDNMSTGVMTSYGTAMDNDMKKIEYAGETCDPMSGKMMKCRQVVTVQDKDHHTMEMFMPGPDGKEMKMMEIKYTRKM